MTPPDDSRRGFLRSVLRGVPAVPAAAPPPVAPPPAPGAPLRSVEATPSRLAGAFPVPDDLRDIAGALARQGYLSLLPDGRFCRADDFVRRLAGGPLSAGATSWLSRTQGRAALDAARAGLAELLARLRAELRGATEADASFEDAGGADEDGPPEPTRLL